MAQRGEFFADLELPETEGAGEAAAEDIFSPPKEDADLDFSAFLDSIPDDLSPPPPEMPREPPPEDESEGTFPEDLLSGFAAEIEAEQAAPGDEAAAFELPEKLDAGLEDLDFSAAPAPGAPEALEDFMPAPDAEASPPEDFMSLPDDFMSPPDEAAAAGTPADESFSLFAEEAPPDEEAPEVESLPSLDAEAPGTDDEYDFSIPDFESPAAHEEPPAAESALDETPLDSFDTFSLDESSLSGTFGLQDEQKTGTQPGFAKLEEFSLAGIDDIFGSPAPGAAPSAAPFTGGTAAQAEVEEIHLSDEELRKLEDTLAAYPLNLRIACEELIAEHAVAPDLMSTLVKQLVRGAGARETAGLAGKILGRQIVIPRGFEKKSGAELEAEQATFAYAFFHHFLPLLRIFAVVALLVASGVYLFFEFIYTPLRAETIYKQGYERIAAGDYARSQERFEEALQIRPKKGWFYKYAEKYRELRQYPLAEETYERLLRWYPRDKKGALDYAAMERTQRGNYAKADSLIRERLLDYDVDDREGLLALGDTNLEWGAIDPSRYEQARRAYARLIERYGSQDEFLERMLKYFIRTDNLAEVLPLQLYFMESDRRRIAAPTLAELGGYLLDKRTQESSGVPDPNLDRIEGQKQLLERAIRQDAAYPESWYHLARYNDRYGSPEDERGSLERALEKFAAAEELSAKRIGYHIDAYRRYGENLIRSKEFISAEQELNKGAAIYEDAVRRNNLPRSAANGQLYALLGDLEYFNSGDMEQALAQYAKAEQDGWAPPDMLYRMGYAHYNRRNWSAALESFFDASTGLPLNRRLLLALGNASYQRGNLNAAQGYYTRLQDLLDAERARFPVLLPNDRPEHLELAERLMRVRNNLGVTLEDLADRMGAGPLRSRALALYAESARAWDAITRNPTTMVRSGSANLAYLNTRNSLYPEAGYERQIYVEIDKDVLEPSPWEKLLSP